MLSCLIVPHLLHKSFVLPRIVSSQCSNWIFNLNNPVQSPLEIMRPRKVFDIKKDTWLTQIASQYLKSQFEILLISC